jgi:hypothetical protein
MPAEVHQLLKPEVHIEEAMAIKTKAPEEAKIMATKRQLQTARPLCRKLMETTSQESNN